jgi:hypothetical protein
MTESAHATPANATGQLPHEYGLWIASLRQQDAARIDPLAFQVLESMARRMEGQPLAVKHILQGKLNQKLASYQSRFEQVQREVATTGLGQPPEATATSTTALPSPLQSLVRAMAQQTSGLALQSEAGAFEPRLELKSVRNFRNTWSKLSSQKQVSEALAQAPQNAGPINSHMLVLRSLGLMRDISPDYLNRFVSYADTLLCLEQTDLTAKPAKPKTRTLAKR